METAKLMGCFLIVLFFMADAAEGLGGNVTRRGLTGKKYKGPCKPTNPIDKCWRCLKNWHQDRKRLAKCAAGFARQTTGGKKGEFYVVTDPSDDDMANPKPGTLRYAVIQKQPLWITFARSMTIKLQQELIMQSHKTIDGRGFKVHIAGGAGITIQFVRNIIIHNLYIHHIVPASGGLIRDSVDHIGFRGPSDGDGISVFGSQNIWLDHLSMKKCYDGIIDVIEGSTNVTISNCHYTDHDKVLLFGARDTNVEDDSMQITVVYNHFGKRLSQRMPRIRSGFTHVVNNDYTHWEMYAIGGSHHATVLCEGNRFIAPNKPEFKEVTHRNGPPNEWAKWTWLSRGDLFMSGAFFTESGNRSRGNDLAKLDGIVAKPAKKVRSLTRFAGALGHCRVGKLC
ncbi:probable pectate lyase P59 [Diospyros lotus]|uniref:probable pectate lyase P59 n=1 Tax=Diospyros lotus TaxID=55363 RepID=UPI002256A634|nr:probable pectate lyase P59 [Diospyros lotus]